MRYWFPVVMLGIGWVPASAVAQAYRSSAQAGATTGVLTLTINKPAGTVNGDMMIAAIAVRPNTATITPPAGWVLIRRTDQALTNANSQATYQKVAGAAEPANYTWTFSVSTGSAGGIMTLYGVNTAAPVDVENGQATASGLLHTAPSVTTTKSYDMIVTTHSFTSSATWTPLGGITEAVDVASDAPPNAVGIALGMNYVLQPVAGATGAKTDSASNDVDVGVAQTVALARGTTATWTGAVNNLWSNGGNWSGLGGTPLAGGEDLVFPGGAANLANSNNIAAGTGFNSVTITGTGYTLAGNSIALGAGNLTDGSVAGSNTISLAMSFAATRTVTVSDPGTALTISGVTSGAGGVTKAGSGTLILSAANTYTGVTTVSTGVLDARTNAALGTVAGATTVASGAALQVDGSGLLIAEPITLNGTGIAAAGALHNLANNNTWSGAVTLGSAARINSDAGTLTVSNTISGATQALTVGGAGNTTVSGVIGTTTGTLTKDGAGTLTLSAANTYTGATTISVGTLKLGIANAVGASSAVTVAGGSTFDLNAFSDVIGSLAGAGTVTSGVAGAVTLTAGGDNTSTTFSGIIQNGTGTVALTKAGTGTLTLSAANTYTGLTTVSAGVLDAQNNTALGTTAGATTVTSGAALQVDGSGLLIAEPLTLNGTGIAAAGALRNLANNNTWSGAVTLGSAARINSDAGTLTVSNTISGATQALTVGGAGNTAVSGVIGTTTGTLTKDGAGTLTLSAANTYTGLTTVSAGVLDLRNNTGLGTIAGATTVASGAALQVDGSGLLIAEPVTLNGTGIAAAGALHNLANNNTWSGAVTLGSAARINSDAGTLTVSNTIGGAAQALTVGGAGNTTVSGVIGTTSGTLTKDGAGTVTLSAANTYTGLTTVSAGVLDAQNNTALGTTAGATTVTGGAALQVDGSGLLIAEPLTLNGTGIAAAGALRNLANNNTWSGAITLGSAARVNSDAGTLTVSNTIGGAAQALTVGGAGNTTVNGVIGTTTGTLTKDGAGTVTLSAANTYTGTTTVSAGVLLVNGTQGSSAVSLNGGTLGGTGTVGAITSTALGGTVSPGPGPGILNSGNVNWSTGSPSFAIELNGATVGSGYDRLNVTGTVNVSGAALSGTVGFAPTDGLTFIIITNDGADAVTGTFAGLPEGSTVVLSGQSFKISYVGGTGNDVILIGASPNLAVANNVVPSGTQPPGTDLAYTVTFTNSGGSAAHTLVLTDSVPVNSDFKVGSVTTNLGLTGLTVIVAYSSDGGSTWAYTPTTGAGGAQAGYDRLVTHVRWTFTGSLSQTVPNNTGSVGFTARIR